MDSRKFILGIVGRDGKFKEVSLFEYAKDTTLNQRTRELYLLKATDFANHRKGWIDAIKQGKYAEYGITADDIVE